MAEIPREVYLNACAEIAKNIECRGFTYSKSGPHLIRKYKDLKFKISFSSSYYNIAGQSIKIQVHAHIDSSSIKKFRSKFHKNHQASQIAVQNICSIEPKAEIFEWNLADPSIRSSIIEQIVSRIESSAIPFFESFENSDSIANKLVAEYVPYIHSMNRVITYLLFYSSEDMAKKSILTTLKRNPELIAPYKEAIALLSKYDLTEAKVYGFAEDMAYYSLVMGWGDLSSTIT